MNRLIHKTSRGFTLIEIMVAMGILVIGMTSVMALYAVAVDAHRRAMDDARVALLADNLLSQIRADFTKRLVDGDNEATFTESYIDLCCRYKALDANDDYIFEEGVDAPNMPGFRCEISLYPLPRSNWIDLIDSVTISQDIADRLAARYDTAEEANKLTMAEDEYRFDVWMQQYWDPALKQPVVPDDRNDPLLVLLEQTLEYKVVVKIIRGEGQDKAIETFRTLIVPGAAVGSVSN